MNPLMWIQLKTSLTRLKLISMDDVFYKGFVRDHVILIFMVLLFLGLVVYSTTGKHYFISVTDEFNRNNESYKMWVCGVTFNFNPKKSKVCICTSPHNECAKRMTLSDYHKLKNHFPEYEFHVHGVWAKKINYDFNY